MTVEGKIYACGEATNGRLGLGLSSGTIPIPRQITALSNYVVKKVAVHSGGRHAMALTVDGKVFSWGEGDDGKLGHFSRMYVILQRNRTERNSLIFLCLLRVSLFPSTATFFSCLDIVSLATFIMFKVN